MSTSIFENAVLLEINRGWPSLSKSLPKQYIKVEKGNQQRFHAQKDLYNSTVLKKLQNNEVKLDMTLNLLCLPFPMRSGTRLLPALMIDEVDKILINHVETRKPLIKEFGQYYDQIVLDSKENLGEAFNPGDYDPVEIVLSQFEFNWIYRGDKPSELLQQVKKEYYQREAQKMAKQWESASEAAQKLLRASMAEMVNHLCDRLAPAADGRRKTFRDSVLEPMNEFVRTFAARNITDDKELAELVTKTQQLISGVDPKNLRSDDSLRISIEVGFTEIKQKLSGMIVDTPSRVVRFED